MDDRDLLDGWGHAITALNPDAAGPDVLRTGRGLLTRWAEPQRRYHTAQHLAEMLHALDELSTTRGARADLTDGGRVGRSAGGRIEVPSAATLSAHDRHLAEVAAWLHDAVYDVRAAPGDSERASATLARKLLAPLGITPDDRHLVEQLILLTIDHGTGLPGALADVFTDADLAILAAPPARFDEYCEQVRAEYAHVPAQAYAAGRTAILRDLVDRPDVYRTERARDAWTDRARVNVRRELDRLSASAGMS